MKMAIGMVSPTLQTPQALSPSALTTTIARIATMISMIDRVAMKAAMPPTSPSSSRAILPSERPPRRMEITSTSRSCTAPARITPTTIQIVPGQITHLGGDDGAHERPGAGDRGEVVAEQDAAVGGDEVLAVVGVLGRGRAAVVRPHQLVLDELAVEAVGDQVGAHGGEHEPDRVHVLAAPDRDHEPAGATQQGDHRPQGDLRRSPAPVLALVRRVDDGGRHGGCGGGLGAG